MRCLGLLALRNFTLINIIIVLHHLRQNQNLLANLFRVFFISVFLPLKVFVMRFLILGCILREQDFFVLIENIRPHIDLVSLE